MRKSQDLGPQGIKKKNLALQVLASKEDMLNGLTKTAAKKYLKEIGVSDETINKLTYVSPKKEKKVKEESVLNEESAAEKFARVNAGEKAISQDRMKINLAKRGYKNPDEKCPECGALNKNCTCKDKKLATPTGSLSDRIANHMVKESKKSEKSECTCGHKFDGDVCPKCGMPKTAKKKVNEMELTSKVNSVGAAEGALKARNITWDKKETVGKSTVWKKGGAIVGAFDPSWGMVKTGEDLLKGE